jgi:hypothetical protein
MYTTTKPRVDLDLSNLDACCTALTHWFCENGLELNASKTDAIIFGTKAQLAKLKNTGSVTVNKCDISLSNTVKILGVHIDRTLSMDAQANSIVSACNYHIRSLRHIRNRLNLDTAKTIACGLVLSRLDYCNSLLFGISDHNMNKLQVVQNDLARTVAYCSSHGRQVLIKHCDSSIGFQSHSASNTKLQ